MNIKLTVGVMLASCVWVAHAACPTTPGRFVAAGAEVIDSKTGLVWARCSVGQVWDGAACSGRATRHTQEEAFLLAQIATGWRLPNVKELASLADKGCQNPAIDATVFPNTLSMLYWSSSPYGGNGEVAWLVNFNDGSVRVGFRDGSAVRLVRAGQ